MHGKATPSPTPIRARVANSRGSDICTATGVNSVAKDQTRTPMPRTLCPPKRSASAPPTVGVRA
eukprot:scaffold1006_cov408-Prasinococcus_capsulatus_cf.AAC.8